MKKLVYDKKVTSNFLDNLTRNIKDGKFIHMVGFGVNFSHDYIKAYYLRLYDRRFRFQGKEYRYFYYCATWRDERCVEVPIAWDYVNSALERKLDILEVGNVLSNYYKFEHDVVDKYEVGKGVINEDIVTFNPNKKYDLIVSVSTIEHVGWDEAIREKGKIIKAFENIRALLKPGALAVITIPLGYNEEFDSLYKTGNIAFDHVYYLKRIGRDDWIESGLDEVEHSKFDSPYPFANALIIGLIKGDLGGKQ